MESAVFMARRWRIGLDRQQSIEREFSAGERRAEDESRRTASCTFNHGN